MENRARTRTSNANSASSSSHEQSYLKPGDRKGKRKLASSAAIGHEDIEAPVAKRSQAGSEESAAGRVACPFFKKDPKRYMSCAKHPFKRRRDIKSHLFRKHMQPEYCPKCLQTFGDNPDAKDTHIREEICGKRQFVPPDGITGAQRMALAKGISSRPSDTDYWFWIWDVLFPAVKRPPSPFLTKGLAVQLVAFQNYLTTQGAATIRDEVISHNVSLSYSDGQAEAAKDELLKMVIDAALEKICQQFVTELPIDMEETCESGGDEGAELGLTPSAAFGYGYAGPGFLPDLPESTTLGGKFPVSWLGSTGGENGVNLDGRLPPPPSSSAHSLYGALASSESLGGPSKTAGGFANMDSDELSIWADLS